MAIPPFPSQDLAKLVLGYLVEEQLMTAYDEFLNESPYLDAQKNEYDRIIMNSLRNILAEYRAARIYVESCKPILLRKKLFQCTNLLEIVKFLVRHIDINKLQTDVSNERLSFDSQDLTTSKIGSDACGCLKLGSCVSTNRNRNASLSKPLCNTESTSLSDVPGNQNAPENRHAKILERQTIQSTSSSGGSHGGLTIVSPSTDSANVEQSSILPNLQMQPDPNIPSTTANTLQPSLECSQNIAEFNTVLNQVYSNSVVSGNVRDSATENFANSRISTDGTFQDFTTGVGGLAKPNISVPDSSTSENMNVQLPPTAYKDIKAQNKRNVKAQQKKKCSFRIGNVKHDVTEISSEVIDVDSVDLPKPKPEEPKVTILSDVRVGNDDRLVRLAPVLQNATSTPLLHMQTIFINGTPVYKPKPPEQKFTYTRDEIMAMPTLIMVSSSGESQAIASVPPQPVMAQSFSVTTTTCSVASSIQPLTVDVSSSSNNIQSVHTLPSQTLQNTGAKVGLVKIVEVLKNASVPKDSILPSSCATSTPQMLPPQRKSSSTPRRTSHVRVLDFTTPRRNLNEKINEGPDSEVDPNNPDEVLVSNNPNVGIPDGSTIENSINMQSNIQPNMQINNTVNTTINSTEENKPTVHKKTVIHKNTNWDADLRALAVASEKVEKNVLPPVQKHKQKQRVKKDAERKSVDKNKNETSVEVTRKKTSMKNNTTPNIRTSKKKGKLSDVKHKKVENDMPSPDFPAIVCANSNEKENTAAKEPDKELNKFNNDERIDTPEVERLSLQNEIGVKLNISDILETPYKQALYDIQMETPRFLGPDLPEDPMSDIKIMNIPTPRFLSTNTPFTPKPAQPTPSSYSSRPTDYSSGGSYYKPDDQDYLPVFEDVECPVTSTLSKEKSLSETNKNVENQPKEKCKRNKSSRPIRQCTKNVSYYRSPMVNKNKEIGKKNDNSSCSDSISANSSFENMSTESAVTPRGAKIKLSTKPGNKTRSLTKNRSPFKKSTQKSFMKIKPRRPTPTKEAGKMSRKSSEVKNPKANQRNRSISKEKVASAPSLVLPVVTKSRRKSSSPRKLRRTKPFNSEISGHVSLGDKENTTKEIQNNKIVTCVQDSDNEQQPLRWSDDGSQDSKVQAGLSVSAANDNDEISQIREYIDKTDNESTSIAKDTEGSLHIDLMKRGFDEKTAKIIERDLLNSNQPPSQPEKSTVIQPSVDATRNKEVLKGPTESDCSTLINKLGVQEDFNEEEEFSVHDCNEDTANYIVVHHDDSKKPTNCDTFKLKDKFSMEVCIDDAVSVRLRATDLNYLFELESQELSSLEANRETEIAVSSISNIERLYTPMKDSLKDQCYKIFDSTLTSIDTPMKSDSHKRKQDCTVSEIVVLDDKGETQEIIEINDKRKRKRSHGSSASEESVNYTKKVKPDTHSFMLNSKEIKDLDIETVLSRLHGP